MIDKIDDYLEKESIAVQEKLLQGLVITEDSYTDFSQLYIKIFLRTDLFNRIDFHSIGYDKIDGRVVNFEWRASEIRRFIAQRIISNIMNVLGLKQINLTMTDKERESTRTDHLEQIGNVTYKEGSITDLISSSITNKVKKLLTDTSQGRRISIEDIWSRKIISMIFPNQVFHYEDNGSKAQIEIFKFFETHFNLACRQPTPRIILKYLELCIQRTRSYYEENEDEAKNVEQTEAGEYPLIKRVSFEEAYGLLSKAVCGNLISYERRWSDKLEVLFSSLGSKKILNYKYIKKNLTDMNDEEIHEFINYLTHIGCARCILSTDNIQKNKYEIPILIQARSYYKDMVN